MTFKDIFQLSRQSDTVDQILRSQLLWMLLLRVVLYTMLSGLSIYFGSTNLDIILMPSEFLLLLLLAVYLTTIFSAYYLVAAQTHLARFGFVQNLLDTLFATLLIYYTGISHSIFSSIYFFPIIAGGLVLPRKGGMIAAASSTLLYGLILTFEVYGYYPSYLLRLGFIGETDAMVNLNHFSIHGLTFFLAAILSALFSRRIRKTEDALSTSLRNYEQLAVLYKQIFDNIATGIITIDGANFITSANKATSDITGYPVTALVGNRLTRYFPTLALSSPRLRQSTDFTTNDNERIRLGYSYVELTTTKENGVARSDNHKIITLRDISEIEQLERQMRQAEKLAAIGMMSAGIAHDFRNPLTAISGSAQILADEFCREGSENQSNYELANIILRESSRLIDTIGDFLKFSRPEELTREWFSLKGCLDEVMQVCHADPTWPLSARIEVLFDETVDIWADRKQMFTVLNHLIQNARSFCPPGRELIEVSAFETQDQQGAEIILVEISDNGSGVPRENIEKIFDPFFTSRADGTGLGLAIVMQVMQDHNGSIRVADNVYGGAKFLLSLPVPA
ncbi:MULTISPECIES: two-component system sensor histidine kinase NtrB [Desulfosediminicola]|uniref:two-component system sensor histidine kinase NtrB n=1 Tax=Desulfosediminicola TaxID=2886823 RepID=UPI0010AC6F0E|nr:ATP-binding protein [Desulfosediminicola ganghwensis]